MILIRFRKTTCQYGHNLRKVCKVLYCLKKPLHTFLEQSSSWGFAAVGFAHELFGLDFVTKTGDGGNVVVFV